MDFLRPITSDRMYYNFYIYLYYNINLIQDIMYEGFSTRIKSLCGATEDFNVGECEHHGSALSRSYCNGCGNEKNG